MIFFGNRDCSSDCFCVGLSDLLANTTTLTLATLTETDKNSR